MSFDMWKNKYFSSQKEISQVANTQDWTDRELKQLIPVRTNQKIFH